jgi:hypothetical protein
VTKLLHNTFRKFSNALDKNAQYYIKLNIDKTRFISFSRKMYVISYNYQIGLHDACIICTEYTKDMGVFLDYNLFSPHLHEDFTLSHYLNCWDSCELPFYTVDCLLLFCTSVRSKL